MNEHTPRRHASGSTGLVWMLLGAALFGYFGFAPGIIWPNTIGGEPNWISIILMWTVRATAVGFTASAALTFVHRFLANLLYSSVGLISAVMFGIVLIWHYTTDAHAPISPVLLLIFAALNGYGSWIELREILATRQSTDVMHDQ